MRMPSFARRLFHCVLKSTVPNHTKKILMLSSVAARIRDTTDPDMEIAAKLNHVLALSNDDAALLLPMQLSRRIWSNPIQINCSTKDEKEFKDLNDFHSMPLSSTQIRIVSDQIVKNTPSWLRYGSNREMKKDVLQVLLSSRQHA